MKHIFIPVLLAIFLASCLQKSQTETKENQPFQFSFTDTIRASSTAIYDTLTGNILPWWDHTFSNTPQKLFIEPFPGGGFYEIFDKAGNGVKHATVIAANRGKSLRLEGPLGLAGNALVLISTIELTPINENLTQIKIIVHGSGEVRSDWPQVIKKVWQHFISERLKPYIHNTLPTQQQNL